MPRPVEWPPDSLKSMNGDLWMAAKPYGDSQSLLAELVMTQKQLLATQEQLLKTQEGQLLEMKGLRMAMTTQEERMVTTTTTTVEGSETEIIAQPDKPKRPSVSKHTRDVQIRVNVRRMYDVRTKEQEFTVRLSIDLYWILPEGETPPTETEDDGDWQPEWTPKFQIRGVKCEDRAEMYTTELMDGMRFVHGEITSLVTISEALELAAFPCDCQDLSIFLTSQQPATQYKFISPPDGTPPVKLRTANMNLDDFRLLEDYPFTYNLYLSNLSTSKAYSTVDIKVKVVRQSRYYIVNVAFIMFLICTFVLCSWAVHPGAIADRWGVDFNLLLTAVAFKLILNDMLPRLSYLTTLDIYVLAGFIFLTLAIFSHSFVPLCFHTKIDYSALTLPASSVEEEEVVLNADLVSFYFFGIGWAFWNVAYWVYFRMAGKKEIDAFYDAAKKEFESIDGADDELVNR